MMAGDDSLTQDLSSPNRFGLRWSGHPTGDPVVMTLVDGNLVTRRTDAPTIRKLVEMSNLLRARVFGDDGERYGLDGSWTHPAAARLANSMTETSHDRRGFLRSLVGLSQDARRRSARSVLGSRAPFRKGDRVADAGVEGIVLGLEFVDGASRDLVVIRASDGRLLRLPLGGNGLRKITP